MGGANASEIPRATWSTEKKTQQAMGDVALSENPQLMKPYKDILTTGKQNISLGEIISPYYGGEESLKSEIEAARAYASNNPKYPEFDIKMDYEKIGEKLPVSSGEYGFSSFDPESKSIKLESPNAALLTTAKLLEMSKSQDDEKQKLFQKFIDQNVYLKEDIQKRFENPVSDFIGTLEHEVGHYPTYSGEEKQIGLSGTHMSKTSELANQLGRIQREAFYLYGKRFTPETFQDFLEQQKSIPEEQRFQNFSPDTRRGLREIYRSMQLPEYPKSFRKLFDVSKDLIPGFVFKNQNSSYNEIENGLTESEKQI